MNLSEINILMARFARVIGIVGVLGLFHSSGELWKCYANYGKLLHAVINSRRSWDYVVFISEQGREELLFSRDNLVSLNGILFWPTPLVHFSDASLTGSCGTFVQGFDLFSTSEKLVD